MRLQHADVLIESQPRSTARATVAISLYNYREHVIPCLDSVRAQTIEPLDLVVVDDCSRDDGAHAVHRWLEKEGGRFDRFVLARHVKNMGLAAARNTGFALARTEFVFVLDADNLLYPRCVQQLTGALDRCDAGFAYCYLEQFGAGVGLHNLSPWRPAGLHKGNTIDAMVLMRRRVWEEVGGYSTDMPVMGWEDFDFWFKLARIKGWGIQVPEILARYRVHPQSMIRAVTNPRADELWQYLRDKYSEFFAEAAV